MKFYEKNLEDLIWQHCHSLEDKVLLTERGFPGVILRGKVFRQVNLDSYGIADLICVCPPMKSKGEVIFRVDIFELKLNTCTLDSVRQLSCYMAAINHIISNYAHELIPSLKTGEYSIRPEVYGHLIGVNHVDDLVFIIDQMQNVFLTEYRFDLQCGLKFKMQDKEWIKTKFDIGRTNASELNLKEIKEESAEYFESEYFDNLPF